MDAVREMPSEILRDVGLNRLLSHLNVAALTNAAATINNQNVAHFMFDGRFSSKAAGATAVATVGVPFKTVPDGNTLYSNLYLGSDGAWLIQQGVNGQGVPDPDELENLLNGQITAINTANPVQITSAGHNLRTGDELLTEGLPALTINSKRLKATRVDANNFTLDGINGAAIGTYVGGGAWRSQKLARAFCGVIKVVLSGSGGFTFGATNWNAAGVTASFFHYATCPVGEKL